MAAMLKQWGLVSNSEKMSSLNWSDFSPVTLNLGDKGTKIVFERKRKRYFVLRTCEENDFGVEKEQLVKLAEKDGAYFLSTCCLFKHNQDVCVGSELFEVSLADVIYCTIPLRENHMRMILRQVAQALCFLQANTSLAYNSLQASSVFLAADETIKLATFGSKILPERLTVTNRNQDKEDFHSLANHMLTGRFFPESATQMRLDAKFEPSHLLLDFIELLEGDSEIQRILKHPWLWSVDKKEEEEHPLARLVLNAERSAWRPCYALDEELIIG